MSTGAMTPEGKARVLAALIEGRQRWLEEIQRAKKAGLIARFPPRQEVGRPVSDPSDAAAADGDRFLQVDAPGNDP